MSADVTAFSIQKMRVPMTLLDAKDPKGDLVQVFQKTLGADASYLDIEVFQRSKIHLNSKHGSEQLIKVEGHWTSEPPLSPDDQAKIDKACEHVLTELSQGDEKSTVIQPYIGMIEDLRIKVIRLVHYCDVLKAKVSDLAARNQELELSKLSLRREKSVLRLAKESLEEQASHSPKSTGSSPTSPDQLKLQDLQQKILLLQSQLEVLKADHDQIFNDLSKKYKTSLIAAAEKLQEEQEHLQSKLLSTIEETASATAKALETTYIQPLQMRLTTSFAKIKELDAAVDQLKAEKEQLEKTSKKQKDKFDEKTKKLEDENTALAQQIEALTAENLEQRTMLTKQEAAFAHQATKITAMFQPVVDAARERFPVKESLGGDADMQAVLIQAVSAIKSYEPSDAEARAKMQAEIDDLKRQKEILLQMFGVDKDPTSITTAALESMQAQALASVTSQ